MRNSGKAETSDALSAVSQHTAETIAEQLQAEEMSASWLPQGQSWSTEAASRESVSVASILAENSRLIKSALTASSLKPSFEEVSALHKLEADQASPLELTEAAALAAKTSLAETQLHASLRDGLNIDDASEVASSVARQIAEPLIEVFEKLSRRESGTLRLQLHPDDLGRVDVQITRDATGRLSAQLSAEHEAARRASTTASASYEKPSSALA
ncbi:MAG: flagellar hook-length control protein FliK [Pyrinomonadaceae bacterium]